MTNDAVLPGESRLLWQRAAADTAQPVLVESDDQQLARRIANGDMRAFEELYGLYHRPFEII